MFGSLEVSTSALVAQRVRIDTIAGNIANAFTTADADGRAVPYRRRVVLFESGNPSAGRGAPGVHVSKIVEDPSPPRLVHEPNHPHAIKSGPQAGYVRYPNVDPAVEMINAIEAARAYEANVTVMDITKTLAAAALRMLA